MNRILGVLICVFVAVNIYLTTTVKQRQDILHHVAHHNDAWAIGQSVTEFMRLEAILAIYAAHAQHVSPKDVRLRLDIIASRITSLHAGSIKQLVADNTTHRQTVNKLSQLVAELDSRFEDMGHAELLDMIGRMRALNAPLVQLSSYSVQQGWSKIDENITSLSDLQKLSTLSVALLIASWCILLSLQIRRNNQLRQSKGQAEDLYASLITTSEKLRKNNEKLTYLAHYDSLTQLPNRTLFWQELEKLFEVGNNSDSTVHVLLLDLDDFKVVNDTLGHDLGDILLSQVGERLLEFASQTYILSRLGGDEFACIILDMNQLGVEEIAETIVRNIKRPYDIAGRSAHVGCSIGIATSGNDNCATAQEVFKRADIALYQAKSEPGRSVRHFEDYMLRDFDDRQALARDLRKAVAENEFEVLYQAQVDVFTLELRGLEALSRWNHPDRGVISPLVFIPLAEEMGIIGDLGKLVLEMACREAMTWDLPIKLAVNISPLQLLQNDFVESVSEVLVETGLPPGRLELEITESIFLNNRDGALTVLNGLRSLGLTIALDDFGTGYSSLAILRDIPFDTLKLDKSFVRDIASNEMSADLVKLVADIGSRLDKTVIIEGVETRAQHERICRIGGLLSQGFLFSRPLKSEGLAFLRKYDRGLDLIEDFVN